MPARCLQPPQRSQVAVGGRARHLADHPLTPPSDVSRRINAERVVVLGWVRAVLLQLAHPLIAAAVVEHSAFRGGTAAALSRLHHTVSAMLALTFGDEQARDAALEGIRTIHRRVHGTLPAACGPFPAGTPYSAEDPALLLWVHATLIDSVVRMYDRLVAPVTEAARDAYCADAADVAVALGARPEDVPRSWRELQTYLDAQLASGAITPCEQARQLAAALLAPSRVAAARPLNALLQFIAIGLLPDAVRAGYGFEWDAARGRRFETAMRLLGLLRRTTPRWIAWWPQARRRVSAPLVS